MASETAFEGSFGAARRSAVHLEMRDGYMLEDPSSIAWKEHGGVVPDDAESRWLFDDERLLVNLCSGDGDWTGAEAVGDPAAVKLCASAFEAVWAAAVPHAEYRPSWRPGCPAVDALG